MDESFFTQFLGTTMFRHKFLSGVHVTASEKLAQLEAVDQTVTAIPEIKEVENLLGLCKEKVSRRINVCFTECLVYIGHQTQDCGYLWLGVLFLEVSVHKGKTFCGVLLCFSRNE